MLNEKDSQNKEHGQHVLRFTIQGKEFEWHDQYITGAEIKKIGDISLESEIYLSVKEPWKDELIKNEDRVDLARPEIEHFYLRQKLKFTIEGKEFEWDRQYIKGSEIRKLGNIAVGYEIFLAIKGPWEDENIKDEAWVDLARPGIEHFYGCKPNTTRG